MPTDRELELALDAVDDRLRMICKRGYCLYDDRNDIRDASDRLTDYGRGVLWEMFEFLQDHSNLPDTTFLLYDEPRFYIERAIKIRIARRGWPTE